MRRIMSAEDLAQLARKLGVRSDWHEPDEQDVTAYVAGTEFDNAMPPATWLPNGDWAKDSEPHAELYVVIQHRTKAVAAVNLASLIAWACRAGRWT